MNDSQNLVELTLAMLRMVVLVSAPSVAVAAIVGLVVGLVQAVTQLQDQAFSFGVKFLAVAVAMVLTLPWLGKAMSAFVATAFETIIKVP